MREQVAWLGLLGGMVLSASVRAAEPWVIESSESWERNAAARENLIVREGLVSPTTQSSHYRSVVKRFPRKHKATQLVVEQSPVWRNWTPIAPVAPANLLDAPVLLVRGPDDYWLFGRYGLKGRAGFVAEDATLDGFDMPLKTTPYENQFDAPGGLKRGNGGYHAWQSRDMENWVHHGPVTPGVARWVTTAEQVDGKTYIYYDFPNDQDPHLYIDEDLTDGVPGRNMGLAFADPSDGSDCAVIRDMEGNFHLIYEDWSPIHAAKHSWDSSLAGHAVSKDGIKGFEIKEPAVDVRTTPTGRFAEYKHPHWTNEDPKRFPSSIARYEIHEPEQDAFGDWAAISIGGRYYLFGDFHPAGKNWRHMSIAWFTASDIGQPFTFCGNIGDGHPDPDIGFAEGKFYLVTQTEQDFVSPGPWVERVEARVGVDTTHDGAVDTWSSWQEIKERYDYIPGFAKQVKRIPAVLVLDELPAGYGFAFELRMSDMADNDAAPVLDRVTLQFE